MLKKILTILFISIMLTSCSSTEVVSENDKLNVVTTLFPQYDFTRQIAKDNVNLKLLLPPGVESHSYELTPTDIININNADLFIYTGEAMEPWVKDILASVENKNLSVIDLSDNINLSRSQDTIALTPHSDDQHSDDEHINEEDSHDHGDYDPHIWTSPLNAKIMVMDISKKLIELDSVNMDYYNKNTEILIDELTNIDKSIHDMLATTNNKRLIFGGHNSMHYFANEYGLEIIAAYNSGMIESDPSVQTIAKIIDTVNKYNIPVIYYEELIDPKVAKAISQDTGAKLLLLHTAHNVSKSDLENGLTYTDIMYNNIENLKVGLQ